MKIFKNVDVVDALGFLDFIFGIIRSLLGLEFTKDDEASTEADA